ncbi:MAG: site-2 protease family protein [Planctomycetes bacterium]|nr:site-2 protease family protein [Planctomycetota bacterium]
MSDATSSFQEATEAEADSGSEPAVEPELESTDPADSGFYAFSISRRMGFLLSAFLLVLLLVGFAKGHDLVLFLILSACAITIHELGHGLAAWIVRIPIQTIRIGIGPVVYSRTIGQVQLEIGPIPVLGWVATPELTWDEMADGYGLPPAAGAEPPLPEASPDEPVEERRPYWELVQPHRRIAFMAGGIALNLLAAVVLTWAYSSLVHEESDRRPLTLPAAAAFTGRVYVGLLAGMPDLIWSSLTMAPTQEEKRFVRDALHTSAWKVLLLLAIINVFIAAFNSLPFPPLDGFRMVVAGVELLWRRELSETARYRLNVAGGIGLLVLLGSQGYLMIRDLLWAVFS